MAVWLWFLFDVLIGAINGHGWAMIGFGALTIFSTSMFTGVFTRTLGIAGIIPVLVIALLAGIPASGGGISLYMVPEFFRDLNGILPLPAAVDIVRATVYFDGSGVAGHLGTIATWGIVCLLIHIGIDWAIARRDRTRGTDGADTTDGGGTPALGGQAEQPVPAGSIGPAPEAASRAVSLSSRRRALRRRS
jgi:hypothetical protein